MIGGMTSLKSNDLHINCTRVWITCNGDNASIDIDEDGFVSGVSSLFWEHVDQLMEIAESREIYVMIALISFDHTKPGNANAEKWVKLYNSETNRQSFADNYAEPFVNRYKDNPFFFAVDVGNELEWVWENHGVPKANVIDLISRTVDAVKSAGDVLVCQGWGAGIKYNTSSRGGSGNVLADIPVDFFNIHYYDWQNQWFSNPFDRSPSYYNINTKPCIIGEAPAKGSAGYTAAECYQKAFEQGWQGLMVWTSNGVDGNGNKYDSKPGTDYIYDHYSGLLSDVEQQETGLPVRFKLHPNHPNPFNPSTTVSYELPQSSFVRLSVHDMRGRCVETLVNGVREAGHYTVEWNAEDKSSGQYTVLFQAGDFQSAQKCLMLK